MALNFVIIIQKKWLLICATLEVMNYCMKQSFVLLKFGHVV